MSRVRAIFLSDVHLGTRACQAERLLDWRPTISLEDGLGPTIAYFRDIVADQPAEGRSSPLQSVV